LLDALVRFDLTIAQRSRRWLSHALELTRRYEVTFYDAAYHAHAIVEQGVFITADARYLQRTGQASACIFRHGTRAMGTPQAFLLEIPHVSERHWRKRGE